MKYLILFLAMLVLSCREKVKPEIKQEPLVDAPAVVDSKLTPELMAKVDGVFLSFTKIETRNSTSNVAITMINDAVAELKMLDRSLSKTLKDENVDKWNMVYRLLIDHIGADLLIMRYRAEMNQYGEASLTEHEAKNLCPESMFTRMKGDRGLYYGLTNVPILKQAVTDYREEAMDGWDSIVEAEQAL